MSIDIIPKDRKMKRSSYYAIRSLLRRTYGENKDEIHRNLSDSILYGIPNYAYKVQSIDSKRSSLITTDMIRTKFMDEKTFLSF